MKKILINLLKIIFSKSYGVGDSIPNNLRFGNLDSLGYYRSKKLMEIIVELESKNQEGQIIQKIK